MSNAKNQTPPPPPPSLLANFWPLFVIVAIGLASLVLLSLNNPPDAGSSGRVEKLEKIDEVVGTGEEAKAGDTVKVHYTGRLVSNKQKFDSSLDRGEPFEFPLGQGRVIQGWDQGVAGMKVGGKRKLRIPAKLGYGERGSGKAIPPDSDLEFDVELLSVGN